MLDFFISVAAAQSAANARDPLLYPATAYAWVIIWSVAGGLVNFYQKFKRGDVRAFNLVELVGELFCSGFVGVVTYWICQGAGVPPVWQAPIIAVSGHMSTRVLFLAEKAMLRWAEQRSGVKILDGTEDKQS